MREFETRTPITQPELDSALHTAYEETVACLDRFTSSFKFSVSENLFYPKSENVEWTTGFWTGQIWLMYEMSHDERLRRAAEVQVDSFLERIEKKIDVDYHDMGFLYSPSCVAAYKLTGNEKGKKAALLAADNLISRFQKKGQFIQAWGKPGERENYRLIIDCLLNLPLLFWSTEVTGDDRYASVARAHIRTAIDCVLRPDNSTYHTYFFDPDTGLPLRGVTHQGYKDGSAWARGQAWGVYGAALGFKYLRDERSKEVFHKTLSFFLDHLPPSGLPYWDFEFNEPSDEPRDSSALSITICGMLEGADLIGGEEGKKLRETAGKLMRVLIEKCAVKDTGRSDGLILHGTYARHSPYNTCKDRGVDECTIWGDYYYAEALVRLKKNWEPYW